RHQAEEAFLEDGILAVPQRQGEGENLIAIGEAGQAVLAPAVSAAAGVVVGEVVPGVAVAGIILTHGAPGAFGEIRPPVSPEELFGLAVFFESSLFSGHRRAGSAGGQRNWPDDDTSLLLLPAIVQSPQSAKAVDVRASSAERSRWATDEHGSAPSRLLRVRP